jgi:imidazolonepropionase-like amidohydrolase
MAGGAIENGVVLIEDGKINAVGPASSVRIPEGVRTLDAAVVTPGLIDGHATVGLTGMYNNDQDQDQLERSEPMQPELRAIDAFNVHEELVGFVRSFGVTTVHTGHGPGELISGQTLIAKTFGNTVGDAVLVETAAVAATLSPIAKKGGKKAPGTRAKMMAMLRGELQKAKEYVEKRERVEEEDDAEGEEDDEKKEKTRDLGLETLGRVINGELPLLVTANRAQDIASVLRLQEEFGIQVWLDMGAESYLLVDEILDAGVTVFVHPAMYRAYGDTVNMSFETAAVLADAGVPIVMQSGYEGYVPKVRVVLFEAAWAAANGLGFERALGAITIDAARVLGIDDRVGSLEIGKDADIALYDGDPFEYTTHCVGVVIDGEVVSEVVR